MPSTPPSLLRNGDRPVAPALRARGESHQTGLLPRLASFVRVVARDLIHGPGEAGAAPEHLAAAVSWLKRAHDASPDDGVSYGYSLKGGWRPSYRETSGYIVVTFFDLARRLGDEDAGQRAATMARWLCHVQNLDGSITNPRYGPRGIVFDTGQVLQGWVRAFEETKDRRILRAAERAADWLTAVADADGRWTRNTHLGVPHAYNTRVAWPLLSLYRLRPKPSRERIARANLEWAVGQQRDGWLARCGATEDAPPFTHTIAYALEGLLESGLLLADDRYVLAAARGARAVLGHLRGDGFLPGRIDVQGRPRAEFACLTGNCQMAVVWLRLFELTGELPFREAAGRALRYVMGCQDLRTADPDTRGAIKGSQPVWGRYAPLTYPSWAAKFFIDALLGLRRASP